jgi:hypothetical protein
VTTISRYESTGVLPSVAMAAQLALVVGASLDHLTGLAEADHELVELARKLAPALSEAQREALAAHLRGVLELAQAK